MASRGERASEIIQTVITLQTEAIRGRRSAEGTALLALTFAEVMEDQRLMEFVVHGLAGMAIALEEVICEQAGVPSGTMFEGFALDIARQSSD